MRLFLLPLLPLAVSGCVASTLASAAVDIVTLPVKVVAKGVDLATTSQAEADQKRGRALRKAEEEAGKRQRLWDKQCRELTANRQPCPPAPDPLAPASPATPPTQPPR